MTELTPGTIVDPSSQLAVDADGTVHVPSFRIPLSAYMSEQAKRSFLEQARNPTSTDRLSPSAPISEIRRSLDNTMRIKVEHLKSIYPVSIVEQMISGVRTDVVTPKGGISPPHSDRVLINLHGGGFVAGAVWLGLAESIPISSIGGFKVVTIDYRMAPEYPFPAASEDVSSVYSALLKQYRPENIGIYGCSAGGSLTAMVIAWLQKEGKPAPGAIGILSASAFAGFTADPAISGSWGGDSRFFGPLLMGEHVFVSPMPYVRKNDLHDPLVSPGLSPSILAQFPPTLLITGTRAYDMSAAVQTQRELTKVGVEANLHVWDGLGHCFYLDENLPESKEAYEVVARFFDKRLGTRKV